MTDKACAVPLHEQLAHVPREARLVIEDADGMGTSYIPVGRMCHEAAEALRARLAEPLWVRNEEGKLELHAPPQREWVGLTDEEIMKILDYGQYGNVPQYARNFVDAIEAKLKEKNNAL